MAGMVDRPSSAPARRPVGSGAGLASIASVASAGAGGLLGVVVARVLGPAETGSYQIVTATLLVMLTVAPLGVTVGATYRASRGHWPVGEALPQLQLAALVLGVGFGAATLGLAALTEDSLFRGVGLGTLAIGLAGLPFALSWSCTAALLLAEDRYEVYALPPLIALLVTLVASAVLAPTVGLAGAVTAVSAGHAITALWLSRWSARKLAGPVRGWLGRTGRELRAAVGFGFKSYLPNVLQLVSYRGDLFVLNSVAAAATVGRYAVALLVTEVGIIVPRALSAVVMPRVAALGTNEGRAEQEFVTGKSVRHSVLLAPVTCAVLSAGVLAIPLVFGGEYREAVVPGLVLVPGVVMIGIAGVLAANVVGRGRPEYSLYGTLIVTPPTIAAYALLIPEYGIFGAAAASTGSYAASLVVTFFFFRRAAGAGRARDLLPSRDEIADYRLLAGRVRARLRGGG